MRISDRSSDVCSSDLDVLQHVRHVSVGVQGVGTACGATPHSSFRRAAHAQGDAAAPSALQIGRASGRERVWQYVSLSVVAVSLKNKNNMTHRVSTYKHNEKYVHNAGERTATPI